MENRPDKLLRPHVETLDNILGQPFKVLDDGMVRVVDYMGDDQAIVQAARVSYGDGTKKTSDDRGLIRYLLRHRHTTPFEMCSLKLHVRVPMDAWRQWIRHRTACLAEGTELYFDRSGDGNTQPERMKIEDIWKGFQSTRDAGESGRNREAILEMRLRHLDEKTNTITSTKIVDVFKNGTKDVFRFTLTDGKSIDATGDHKFKFQDGWGTFHGKTNLGINDGRAVWNGTTVALHVNGTEAAVAGKPVTRPKLVEVVGVEYLGRKETYDVEVAGPHHNFIANGIVTHNSVNETSTRYSLAIDSAQRTGSDQWRIQAEDNKQGSSGWLDPQQGEILTKSEADLQDEIRRVYNQRLGVGVAREQARKDLPLCTYTEAYWKMDLHNLLHFLALRMDSHAQKEIRDFATVIGQEIVARWVPLAWEAFLDYRMGAVGYSRIEHAIMAAIGAGNSDLAVELAAEAGWLRPAKKSGFVRNRERGEFEAKMATLSLRVPWLGRD